MRRELETEPRNVLNGHDGGNAGYRQGFSYGPPRQFPTLPLIRPDLSAQAAAVPQLSSFALILFGLAFATLNSFAEEAVFRGVFMHTLKATLGSEQAALILQAVIFGFMHVRGFPSGPYGMIIAGVVGLAFGHLRLRTGGILAPWLAHAVVNVLMFLYLAIFAGRTIP